MPPDPLCSDLQLSVAFPAGISGSLLVLPQEAKSLQAKADTKEKKPKNSANAKIVLDILGRDSLEGVTCSPGSLSPKLGSR